VAKLFSELRVDSNKMCFLSSFLFASQKQLDSQRRVVSDKGVLRNIFSVGFSSVDTVREERAQLLNDYDTRTAGTGVIEALQD